MAQAPVVATAPTPASTSRLRDVVRVAFPQQATEPRHTAEASFRKPKVSRVLKAATLASRGHRPRRGTAGR